MNHIERIKQDILPTIPNQPGIYKYYDDQNALLYVGKAKDLRKRVASYFVKNHELGKTRILVSKIARIEFTVVETEQDALLLENVLIKEWQPRYNIMLKDDKTYPYICIKNERFPRVFLTRQVEPDGSEYLGPYASVTQAKNIVELVHQLFKLRTCAFNLSAKNIADAKFKVCLQYHLGNCKGPCEGKQAEEEYAENIKQIRKILKGNIASVIKYLKEKIQEFADAYEFEKAQDTKVIAESLQHYQSKSTVVNPAINNVDVFNIDENEKRAYISFLKVANGAIIQTKVIELVKKLDETPQELLTFGIAELRQQFNSQSPELILPFDPDYPDKNLKITIPLIGDKRKLLDLAKKNAYYYKNQFEIKDRQKKRPAEQRFEVLNQLKKDLRLAELPQHIECFDNSNFQGSYPVASMVVFKDGKPANKEYRHFKIKTVEGPNDFASMEEIVYRRYKRLLEEQKPLPQLILIDGGKGQLSAAVESLKKTGIYERVAVAGIAKKLEEIYVPNDPYPLHIDKRSASLRLLQHIRNEAHRFAITFHRQLRSKGTFKSGLENIPGIGEKTAQKLLTTFKSIANIRQADEQDLKKVLNERQLKALKNFFETGETDS
ncbi:excinuclease ABC subunit UvrC [Sphingobacteriales bacterium UPWRP_1]|nr:excinuclease ABC subunit C [Sphingobacteriales bacterium TSM_CSS]PSJ71790.1 excinuclease ABC subunit UvrC [Sphingobacteriales bacterium UPWRP_1]